MLKALSFLTLSIPLANAFNTEEALKKIKVESESITNTQAGKLKEYFSGEKNKELNKITGYDPNLPIANKDIKLEQAETSGYTARQQEYKDNDHYQCTKDKCEVGHTFSTHATLKREKQAEITGFSKDKNGQIKNNKGFLDAALKTVKDAKNNFNFLRGEYSDCEKIEEKTEYKTEEHCEQYFDINKNGCFANQVVEIDPKYTYICSKTRQIKEKLCAEVLKEMKCKQSTECAAGGVIPGSVESGMEWHYDKSSSTLRLGSLGAFYWFCGNSCQKVVRSARFAINHKELIKTFRLKKLFLNNLLQVSLNGSVVYNSLGGNKLEIKSSGSGAWIDAGQGKGGSCMINHGRQIPDYVSIDLLPYLNEGQNEITLELAYSFNGHIHIEIEAKQRCCTEWEENKEEQCVFL